MEFIDLAGMEFSPENYRAAIDSLFSQIPSFQRVGSEAYKPGLDRSLDFDALTGFPSRSFRSVHVAGTNGKGSVSSMLAAVMTSAGYRTGLYTSPHLVDFRERMRVDGNMIPEDYVYCFLRKYGKEIKERSLSFFEITTAMAFSWFRDSNVDVAVVETGLGGRLDSTNIITPVLSVITNIGLDHCEFLGHTLQEIAGEKAGIIKDGVPAVLGEPQPEYESVFREKAASCGSDLYFASGPDSVDFGSVLALAGADTPDDVEMGLHGACQSMNIRTVLAALLVLAGFQDGRKRFSFNREAVVAGIRDVTRLTGLRGRWECISESPRAYCDTGHNAHGLKYVFGQLAREKYGKLYIVFGVVADKDLDSISHLMPVDAYYFFTQAKGKRALPADVLAERLGRCGLKGEVVPDVRSAYRKALAAAGKDDVIYVGGSTFVVAEVLE